MIDAEYRILVVDDDPETAEMLRSFYRAQPYEILDAGDGEEGLRRATADRPDLVLLDIEMPLLDGLTVVRRMKEDPETNAIPVILLSARRDKADKIDGFSAGADDYVTKPFEVEELDARIRAMLSKRQVLLDLRAKKDELERLYVADEMTGLANYRKLQQRLKEEWLRAERYETPLSLIVLDLDDFKKVNDSLGHPMGDRVLREFALLVAGGARATDLAARYGGEEFVVLLPHTSGGLAVRVAERIRAAVEEFPFLGPESPRSVTVSAGVATWPSFEGIHSGDGLLQAADRALYRAKRRGKNRVIVDDGTE